MHMLIDQLDIVIGAMESATTEREKDIAISLFVLIVEHYKTAIRQP
jgi:hypothetical protein